MSREEEIREGLFEHTLNGHAPEVKALTEEALALGMDPMDVLFKALIPSLEEVGGASRAATSSSPRCSSPPARCRARS
jgi:methanogenic corrinoid protein MtbC1